MGKAALLLAALAAAGAALLRLRRLFLIGAAYKAKVLCSALFVSGLPLDAERADEVSAEAYRPLRLLRARVDRAARTVSVSFLGLGARRAIHRPGLGATLAWPELPGAPVPPEPPRPGDPDAPWPAG